jgi:hypothetical protein
MKNIGICWRGGVLVRVRTASSSSASARRRCRQTWCTPMTIESMEKRTEQSEAVCGRVLMFCVMGFFLGVSNLYYIFPLEPFGDACVVCTQSKEVEGRTGTARKATLALVNVL